MQYEALLESKAASWGAVPGTCYIVPTPLGNLGDFSYRALVILKTVQLIAAEDTRVTQTLLKLFEIRTPICSYRDENERPMTEKLIQKLKEGLSVALVSDAGTPTISDPGYRLIKACRDEGLPVVPLPGPCALITALSGSGMATDRFFFGGFLPPKTHGRCQWFLEHQDDDCTVIVYESCHRILASLEDALKILGPDRRIAIARELTKKHETFYTGALQSILEQIALTPLKGEYVLIIGRKTQ